MGVFLQLNAQYVISATRLFSSKQDKRCKHGIMRVVVYFVEKPPLLCLCLVTFDRIRATGARIISNKISDLSGFEQNWVCWKYLG